MKVEDDSSFCRFCGTRLPEKDQEITGKVPGKIPERKHTEIEYGKPGPGVSPMTIVIIVAIIILVLAVVASLVITRNTQPGEEGGGGPLPPEAANVGEGKAVTEVTSPEVKSYFSGFGNDNAGPGGGYGPALTGEINWIHDVGDSVAGYPVAADGRVYVAVVDVAEEGRNSTEMVAPSYRDSIIALDAATGDQIWQTDIAIPGKISDVELFVEGGSLYGAFQSEFQGAGIFKLDLTLNGAPVWPEPIIQDNEKLVGADFASGIVALVTETTTGENKLRLYNGETGKIMLATSPEGKASAPVGLDNGIALMEGYPNGDAYLVIRDMKGETVSRTKVGFSTPVGRPTATSGRVIVSGLWSFGRLMVEAYDTGNLSGKPLWRWDARVPGSAPPPSGAVVLDAGSYFVGPDGRLVAIDNGSGNLMPIEGRMEGEFVSPPVSDGATLYSVTDGGRLYGVQTGENLKYGWFAGLPVGMDPMNGMRLAYDDGRVFIACKGGILAGVQ